MAPTSTFSRARRPGGGVLREEEESLFSVTVIDSGDLFAVDHLHASGHKAQADAMPPAPLPTPADPRR